MLPGSWSHSLNHITIHSKCIAKEGRGQEGRGGVGEEACSPPSRSSRLSRRVPWWDSCSQKHPQSCSPAPIKCILTAVCQHSTWVLPTHSEQAKTQPEHPWPHTTIQSVLLPSGPATAQLGAHLPLRDTAILHLQSLSRSSAPQWPRTWSAGTLQPMHSLAQEAQAVLNCPGDPGGAATCPVPDRLV